MRLESNKKANVMSKTVPPFIDLVFSPATVSDYENWRLPGDNPIAEIVSACDPINPHHFYVAGLPDGDAIGPMTAYEAAAQLKAFPERLSA